MKDIHSNQMPTNQEAPFVPPVRRLHWAALMLLLLPTGCQSYHRLPLNAKAVAKTLKITLWRQLRVAVKKTSAMQLPKTMLSPSQAITPNRAAALALILNPSLRAIRDLHGEASAQLMQAGILTNPVLSASGGLVEGHYSGGAYDPYGIGVSWNIRQLIDREARISSASYQLKQVDLEVVWREWQTAEAARLAVYAIAAAQEDLRKALFAQHALGKVYAVAKHAGRLGLVTLFDLGVALRASQQARSLVLIARQRLAKSQFDLARDMGLPPGTTFVLSPSVHLPVAVHLPNVARLEHDVEKRRVDLLALHKGYQSQEERLRAAVLRQFPSVSIGFMQTHDDTNINFTSFGVNIALPIFDRNQGRIALARATRRMLYDTYMARVFNARSDIGEAAANIRALQRRIRQSQSAVARYGALAAKDLHGLRSRNIDIAAYAAAAQQWDRERITLVSLRYRLARNLIALELASGDGFFEHRAEQSASPTKNGDTR